MKKQYIILGLLLASFQFVNAQFTFDGEFRNGNMYDGTLIYNNGDKYVGQFNDQEEKHGKGKYYWKNGETFDGEWRNDNMYDGTNTFVDGKKSFFRKGIKGLIF